MDLQQWQRHGHRLIPALLGEAQCTAGRRCREPLVDQGPRDYCQPPVALLERLVAVRVHLDDCGADDGALNVVPGSHRYGRLSPQAAVALREQHGLQLCLAKRGDAVLLRPLLLHASSKARAASRRRVLHFVFGPPQLPGGLRWYQTV